MMLLNRDKIIVFLLLLSLSACVSRKKYNSALSESGRTREEYVKKADSLLKENAGLKMKVDSLEAMLAAANTKEKEKTRTYAPGGKKSSKLSAEDEYNSKALYMYNFCKYVQWPSSFQSDSYIICVAGDSPIMDKLVAFTRGKTVNNKKIIVRKYDPKDKSLFHILFISDSQEGSFNSLRAAVQNNPTLVVTENPVLASSSHISFTILGDKVKYIVNKAGAEKAGLKISQDLIKFAVE